jgi:TolB-like protein/Tfp pilus assembly protein PilF
MLKFDNFELDQGAYELRRGGRALKLERIPMDLLCLLAANAGQLVSRDLIIEKLWGKEVFLDTSNSINTAIRKIRQTLRDDPRNPRFVQTVPGKGYRFVAAVTASGFIREGMKPSSDAARPAMLAVLPFENLSNDVEQEYFSDGLTEETIAHLGLLDPQSMGVIARTSSMVYKRTKKTITKIGEELGVNYIIEGSVRREKDRVRITAQLIRVADQTHVWAESYDRDIESVLGIQTEIGVSIAHEVRLKIGGKVQPQLASGLERNPEAHDAYLRGRYHWAKRTLAETRRAIEYFRKATDLDPTYALAYAGLADCYITLPITSDLPSKECFPKAKAAAGQALEFQTNLAEAHTSLGTIRFWFDWDWAGADECYEQAVKINPNYVLARLYRAHCLSNFGRHEEAIAEIKRAIKLDPLSPILSTLLGEFLYHGRRYDEAVAEFLNAVELAPNFWVTRTNFAKVYEQTGEPAKAIAELEVARAFSEGSTEPVSLLGYVFATTGRHIEAEKILADLLTMADRKYVPPFNIALVFAGLRQDDRMFEWLERGLQDRDVRMTFLRDPKWDRLRKNARFQEILREVGLNTH